MLPGPCARDPPCWQYTHGIANIGTIVASSSARVQPAIFAHVAVKAREGGGLWAALAPPSSCWMERGYLAAQLLVKAAESFRQAAGCVQDDVTTVTTAAAAASALPITWGTEVRTRTS